LSFVLNGFASIYKWKKIHGSFSSGNLQVFDPWSWGVSNMKLIGMEPRPETSQEKSMNIIRHQTINSPVASQMEKILNFWAANGVKLYECAQMIGIGNSIVHSISSLGFCRRTYLWVFHLWACKSVDTHICHTQEVSSVEHLDLTSMHAWGTSSFSSPEHQGCWSYSTYPLDKTWWWGWKYFTFYENLIMKA